MRIVIFGDSISEGFWDYEKGGWVNMLKTYFWKESGYDKMVANFGISAYTSNNIIRFFEHFFNGCSRREQGKEKESIILISIGINDCSINKKTLVPRVDKEEFIKNLEDIIKKCENEELIKKVFFLTNINVNEDIVNNSENLEFLFFNKEINLYNDIIKNLCEKNKVEYLDLFGLMSNDDLEDGLHPNTKGHEKIFKEVKNFLSNRI